MDLQYRCSKNTLTMYDLRRPRGEILFTADGPTAPCRGAIRFRVYMHYIEEEEEEGNNHGGLGERGGTRYA